MLEASILSQDKKRLQIKAAENDKRAQIMLALLSRTDRLLSALLICNNLANVTCASAATAIAVSLVPATDNALLLSTFIVTFIILVCSEITPKVLGVRYSQPIALFCAFPLKYLIKILSPVIHFVNFFASLLLKVLRQKQSIHTAISDKPLNAQEVRTLLRHERSKRNHSNAPVDEFVLLEKAIEFQAMSVEKIMSLRQNIVGINLKDNLEQIEQTIRDAPFSKLPIYNGNLNETIGVVYTVDAINKIDKNQLSQSDLIEIAKPTLNIPAAAAAAHQMQIMRQSKCIMGMVIDGSGRVIGAITFSNFASAIIGEETLPSIRSLGKSKISLSADTRMSQLQIIDPRLVFPATNAHTLNGFLLETIGDLPDGNFGVAVGQLKIISEKVDNKSIEQVTIILPDTPPTPPEEHHE